MRILLHIPMPSMAAARSHNCRTHVGLHGGVTATAVGPWPMGFQCLSWSMEDAAWILLKWCYCYGAELC